MHDILIPALMPSRKFMLSVGFVINNIPDTTEINLHAPAFESQLEAQSLRNGDTHMGVGPRPRHTKVIKMVLASP